MKRLLIVLTAALACPLPAAAETPYTCGTATLRDVEAVTRKITTPSVTRVVEKRNKRGERVVTAETSPSERESKSYLVTLQLDDIIYTAESAGNFWNFDPTALVINDPIGVCLDKKQVILKRPDGKDFKARIVRAARSPRD